MAEIALSNPVRQNLISLQSTAELLSDAQYRLSTGRKVNSAIDDPTAFYTARGLDNRANDLENLLDSVGIAIESLRAADDGIEAITSLVEAAKAAATQALATAVDRVDNKLTLSLGSTTTGTTTLASANFASDGDTLAFVSGSTSTDIAVSSTTTVDELVAAINAVTGVSASFSASGDLEITNENGLALSVSGATGSSADTLNKSVVAKDSTRESFLKTFNSLREQITQVASDSHYNGINLLDSDKLTVFFNPDQSSSLDINGVNFSVAGLNISTAAAGSFDSDAAIRESIKELDAAINALRDQAAVFGGNLSVVEIRKSFTTSLINTLQNGSALLTLADTNEEGANLLALSTRQQLGTRSLALANQSEQNVLRLF